MIAVLMDADHTGGLLLIDQVTAAFHILYLFITGRLIIQARIAFPGHQDFHPLLFQKTLHLARDYQV